MRCLQIKNSGPFIVDDACLVSGSSFVYDAALSSFYNIYPFDPNTEYFDDEISRTLRRNVQLGTGRIDFEFCSPPKIIAHIQGLCIPLCLLHTSNYFHFLIQALPTLAMMKSSGLLPSDAIIVTGPLKSSMRSALEILLEDKSLQTIELKKMNAVKCEKVLLTQESYFAHELQSGLPPTGHYIPNNILLLRSLLLNNQDCKRLPRGNFNKIFVYRKSLWRNIVNIDEIADIARDFKFTIIQPENFSFEEQMAIFSNSSTIVGPTGAWMANLIFAERDTRVMILYPDTMQTNDFWSEFASLLNLRLRNHYFSTKVPQNTAIRDFQPMHSDFYVSADSFVNMLTAA